MSGPYLPVPGRKMMPFWVLKFIIKLDEIRESCDFW